MTVRSAELVYLMGVGGKIDVAPLNRFRPALDLMLKAETLYETGETKWQTTQTFLRQPPKAG